MQPGYRKVPGLLFATPDRKVGGFLLEVCVPGAIATSPADDLELSPATAADDQVSDAADEDADSTTPDFDTMSREEMREALKRLSEENAAKKKRREAGKAGADNREKLRADKAEADLAAIRQRLDLQEARDAQVAEQNSEQLAIRAVDQDMVAYREKLSQKVFDDDVLDELCATEKARRLELIGARKRSLKALEIEWTQARVDRIAGDLKKAAARVKKQLGIDVQFDPTAVTARLKRHVFDGPDQQRAGLYARIELDEQLETYIDEATMAAIEDAKKGVKAGARQKALSDREADGTDNLATGTSGSMDYETAMRLRVEGKLTHQQYREAMADAPASVRARVGLS